ncbi:hypothetical protein [Variovorax sp. LjRoot290]|uniref:hypothetical protein n=1 Tax=Variovorax sp. LjRoot290 TaxID=3342316 RepID=UPI003F514192
MWQMRLFYTAWPTARIHQPLSGQSRARRIPQTSSGESALPEKRQTVSGAFPDLPAIAQLKRSIQSGRPLCGERDPPVRPQSTSAQNWKQARRIDQSAGALPPMASPAAAVVRLVRAVHPIFAPGSRMP